MKNLQDFSLFVDRFCRYGGDECGKLPSVLDFMQVQTNRQVQSLEILTNLCSDVYKKMVLSKRISTSESGELIFDEDLLTFTKGTTVLLMDTIRNTSNSEVCRAALTCAFSFIPQQAKLTANPKFPFDYFVGIMTNVVGAVCNARELEEVLTDYLHYKDTRDRLWPALEAALVALPHPLTSHIISNAVTVINTAMSSEKLDKTLSMFNVSKVKNLGNVVQSVWNKLSDTELLTLPSPVHQALLLMMIQHIMPIIDHPVLLTDHLVLALDKGGPVAMVALQGIFTLIQKYNIEYPNIYSKLYNLFTPVIFASFYKSRFYYLSDIFLTSTHLSSTLVAGFVKRFLRLALVAPPEDAVILLAMSLNLLIRHTTLLKMFHNPGASSLDQDPYDSSAEDPVMSGAEKSSVWEAEILTQHPVPTVASSAAALLRPPPSVEIDLAPLLDSSSDLIFAKECKKKMKEPPLTFERPSLIFSGKQDLPYSLWSLT